MKGLEEYTEAPEYPQEFGAKIFKISRDAQGNRMSHMKITGGSLSTREIIDEEKVNQIRLYSGEKFETVREASAGAVCAVLGLAKTVPGQGLGIEAASAMPLLEPVMTYRIGLPEGVDAAAVLPKFRELEEETGYRVESPENLEYLMSLTTTVAFCDEAIDIFVAHNLIPSHQNLDEDEVINVVPCSLGELEDMIYTGKITDGKTIAAIMAYARKYRSEDKKDTMVKG